MSLFPSWASGAPIGARFGWQDFADRGLVLPEVTDVAGGTAILTNDASGTLTDGNSNVNAATTLPGVTDLWNSSTNFLNFGDGGLRVNDYLTIRTDFVVTAAIVPLHPSLTFRFFSGPDGGGSEVFSLAKNLSIVSTGAGLAVPFLPETGFFIGESIASGSMRIELTVDVPVTVRVNGWNIQIHRRG